MSKGAKNNHLKSNVNEFLSNKRNIEALTNVIDSFKNALERQIPVTSILLSCETIFVELLRSRDMTIQIKSLQGKENTPENNYKQFLQERYIETFNLIVECLGSDKQSDANQALSTCMKFIAIEGTFPLEIHDNNQTEFPIVHLNKVISKLLLSQRIMKNVIVKLSEYTMFDDFCYFVWKLLLKNLIPTTKNDLTNEFVQNYLELLNVLIPASPNNNQKNAEQDDDDEKRFLCRQVKFDQQLLRKNVNKIWNFIVQWPHNDVTQRQLLVLLLEKVLIYLDKPALLTDYLMDTLDVGGQVSLLALQGIFILIHKYNMSYPNIYEKLYAMFEPEIFHMKFKPRLFHLADIFLSSTYLPETLVAAFAKRLARLSLVAPPQDIIIILYFIGNLIIRHPGLKRLICDANGGHEISNDPFLMDECDPNKSFALQSSLWEIQLLKSHMLPYISQTAKNITSQPLPNREWDLGEYLEVKENDLFDQEISKKAKEYALTFERPMTETKNQHTAISKYWKF
ncbi:nucleolar complex protein 4 homolog A [Chironomus tepperi]|uniref:nucleolar complex protein 4 homolog A n=1 Tax=Chironomus tepperi TaxID=113505 RepID=UPI00391F4905